LRAIAIAEDRTLAPTELEKRPLQPQEARVEAEFSGTLTEVADAVEGFSLGDRVVVYPFSACGECPNCRRGDDHVCQQAAVTGLGLGTNPGAAARGGASRKLVPPGASWCCWASSRSRSRSLSSC
jgi:threonine dehydrogenase-like Zn-dependent dehydrogenase